MGVSAGFAAGAIGTDLAGSMVIIRYYYSSGKMMFCHTLWGNVLTAGRIRSDCRFDQREELRCTAFDLRSDWFLVTG